MNLSDIFSLANIAGALVAIAVLLTLILHRLDPGTRDKLGGAQHRRWGVWCMGAGHGKRGQK